MIKIPFGPYKDFAECVRENSDKKDPNAYCATIMREVEGKPEGKFVEEMPKIDKRNKPLDYIK